MPFTMHGQDLVFLNYFPMKFVTEGIWDPYGFISVNFAHFRSTYYGPVLFFVMSAANFIIIKCFNPASLVTMLELSSSMMEKHSSTIDYVQKFSNLDLFKNLFLMKSTYLVFDLLIGGILLKLAISQKAALDTYKIWMLNIIVLHDAYMTGGANLITAFFMIAALYTAVKKRPYFSVILLGLGGATKLFPYILILPVCLLLGDNWKTRFSLMFMAGIAAILPYVPFYFSSGGSVSGFFISSRVVTYHGMTHWVIIGTFMALYSFVSINALKDSTKPYPEKKALYYFLALILIGFMTFPAKVRYFVFITPFLALFTPRHKRFGIFILSVVLMVIFSSLTRRDLQMGLFAPLDPAYFSSLPTIHEILGRFVNIEIVYKVLARMLFLSFFAAAAWVWRIKLGSETKGEILC